MNSDTIVAIATANGVGGIGIIRVSGSDSLKIVKNFFKIGDSPESHKAVLGKVYDDQEIVDRSLAIFFKGPNSFTGEDTVEFHCHGSPYILNKVLHLALRYGARIAEPGEFTKRAFLNGKIDLTQAEAVYDLINAKTSLALKSANDQLEGKLSTIIKKMRQELLAKLSHIEAIIDFPDEIDEEPLEHFAPLIKESDNKIAELLQTAETGKIYREGVKVAIAGKPNAGKSSLLNSLLRFERAIVTEIAGTTRDTLEEYISIRGIPIQIVDTAGLRETEDQIEKMGIERSRNSIEAAQLVLFVVEATTPLAKDEKEILALLQKEKAFIIVCNKIDLSENLNLGELADFENLVFISAKFDRGIEKLEDKIASILLAGKTDSALSVNINNRHQEILYRASESLQKCLKTISEGLPIDFLAIDLKAAIISMGEVIGEEVTEEVITEIFANFCVGK